MGCKPETSRKIFIDFNLQFVSMFHPCQKYVYPGQMDKLFYG